MTCELPMNNALQYLLIMRHAESDGDVRRNVHKNNGVVMKRLENTDEEDITQNGIQQSERGGRWIKENFLKSLGITEFGGYFTSPTKRTRRTAASLGLPNSTWVDEPLLKERNRGKTPWPASKLAETDPENYRQMVTDPLGWVPIEGESILQVGERAEAFIEKVKPLATAIAITHRDWLWASALPLEKVDHDALTAYDTEGLGNCTILIYSSINPQTGEKEEAMKWKKTVRFDKETEESEWVSLEPQQMDTQTITTEK